MPPVTRSVAKAEAETRRRQGKILVNLFLQQHRRNYQMSFKIRMTTKMIKPKEMFCNAHNLRSQSVRLFFEGRRISDTDSPNDLDLKDGDDIDVLTEQAGGVSA